MIFINRKVAILVVLVILLAVFDVGLTLCHLQLANGIKEANPFMKWVLDSFGSVAFVSVKMLITGIGALLFAWQYSKSQWAKIGLWSVLIGHCLLAVYHIYLAMVHWT